MQRITIIGVGGTGCAVATYLSISSLPILLVDDDIVSKSNLDRQILYDNNDVGKEKVNVAHEKLKQYANITVSKQRVSGFNLDEIFNNSDIIVDCSDDPFTKYLMYMAIREHSSKLLISSAIASDYGYLVTLSNNYCMICHSGFPNGLVSGCSDNLVFKPLVGVLGSLQALEVLKSHTGRLSYLGVDELSTHELDRGCFDDHRIQNCGKVSAIEVEHFMKHRAEYSLVDISGVADNVIAAEIKLSAKVVLSRLRETYTEKPPLFICRRGITARKIAEMHALFSCKNTNYLIGGLSALD
jgi:adenylyltransferase/sulfurtransferase